MHPVLFEIPGLGLPLRSFGVLLALGFLGGSWWLGRLVRRYGDDPEGDPERISRVTFWVMVGVVIGARLMYVLVEVLRGSETGRSYVSFDPLHVDPVRIMAVWEGGLVMYGGLFGGVLCGLLSVRAHGMRLWHNLDLGLTAGFLGLAIGRVGCYLVGDDYGRVVPGAETAWLPFSLRVPEEVGQPGTRWEQSLFGQHNAGEVLYATQVWMSLNSLLLAGFGAWLLRRRRYAGQVSLWLVLSYAITRGAIEHFRGDAIRGKWFDDALSTSQIVSIVVGLAAAALLWRFRGRGRDAEPATPAPRGAAPRVDA